METRPVGHRSHGSRLLRTACAVEVPVGRVPVQVRYPQLGKIVTSVKREKVHNKLLR
jgi:hypothetical protein